MSREIEFPEDIAKYIAEVYDNAIIEFLRNNGYRPRRDKRYFYDLRRRLKRKGLKIVCEDVQKTKTYYDYLKTGIFGNIDVGEINVRFEEIKDITYKKKIKVDDEFNLYKKHTFKFNPGVTILIGRNGSGKSTLLNELNYYLKQEKIPVYFYRNEDHEKVSRGEFVFSGKIDLLAQSLSNSEGQDIAFNFGNHIGKLGRIVKNCIDKGEKELFVLLDGLDSGLSIDGIDDIKGLFDLIIEDAKGMDVYIIVSANTYEFVRESNCLYVSTGNYMRFNNYEDYRRFILKGKKR